MPRVPVLEFHLNRRRRLGKCVAFGDRGRNNETRFVQEQLLKVQVTLEVGTFFYNL